MADYAEPVNRVIGAFKHASLDWLAKPLAQRCWQSFADELQEFDALVPVPLHFWRQRRRGFNQSELLAKELAARLALPVIQPLRRRRGPALSTLTHDQRRAWAHRTLDLRRPRRWKVGQRNSLPNKLLLVDDVLTTGATARRACELLQRAGARSVAVLAFARTP